MFGKRRAFLYAATAGIVLTATACSTGESGKTNSESSNPTESFDMSKPVELSFYSEIDTTASDEDFMREFGQYIRKKYPNVTFKNNSYVAQTKQYLDKTVAAGTKFDLVQMSFIQTSVYLDLKVGSDITDLIGKHKIDLSGVNPIPLNQLKSAGGGQLIGLPYQINSQILFYNKAIFDKFGVPYPKDGMTWQDVTDIVRRTTRLDGGVQYTGFALQQGAAIFVRSNQLSIEPIDLKTNKAAFGNDQWKKFFEAFLPIYQIQGNTYKSTRQVGDAFFKDQTVAMVLAYPNFYTFLPESMNWDMVSTPSMQDRPGVSMPPVPSTLVINANSPFRDEAFLVAMEMLSKSVQLERAKNYGIASVLTDPEIKKEIGTGIPALNGKNRAAMQPANMAPSITFTEYTADVVSLLGTAFNTAMDGTKDVNTALREAEEAANKKIEERMAAKAK